MIFALLGYKLSSKSSRKCIFIFLPMLL
uniref:Uncharacterized protein n=1 Tax=Rhizophora mucronata TaxID=61149 RepID=A0A2P2Q2F8_RHIMU